MKKYTAPVYRNLQTRIYNSKTIKSFKQRLHETNWDEIKSIENANDVYKKFLKIFIKIYDEFFPKIKIKLKQKRILSPWITNGTAKSFKRKQKLYDKFLERRTPENQLLYKAYKNLFETIKSESNKKVLL